MQTGFGLAFFGSTVIIFSLWQPLNYCVHVHLEYMKSSQAETAPPPLFFLNRELHVQTALA